jgi:hypothetical protein
VVNPPTDRAKRDLRLEDERRASRLTQDRGRWREEERQKSRP